MARNLNVLFCKFKIHRILLALLEMTLVPHMEPINMFMQEGFTT